VKRPDYLERRIDFHLARQRARREHPQPCDCPYCITTARIHERLMENANKGRPAWDGIPF
jgi:hypothetical protein